MTASREKILVGIDPGPKTCGVTILRRAGSVSSGYRHAFAWKGESASDATTLRAGVMVALGRADISDLLVGIERIEGFGFGVRGRVAMSSFLETGEVVGALAVAFFRKIPRDLPRNCISRKRAAHVVLGMGRSPTDAELKRVIPNLIHGWPKISNAHHRDAALVALAASFLSGGVS